MRSCTKIAFSSFVAGGLCCSKKNAFIQYPLLNCDNLSKLNKLYNPVIAKEYLEQNIISSTSELRTQLETGYFDLIILLAHDTPLFSFQKTSWMKKLRNLVAFFKKNKDAESSTGLNCFSGITDSIAKIAYRVPIVIIDFDDWICLSLSSQHILQYCTFYYKRELPFNRFFLYYQHRPAHWRKMREQLLPHCAKMRRMPLGIEDQKYQDLKKLRKDEQDIDVFFCSQPTSTLRIRAIEKLSNLADTTNWKIVLADSMPFKEFCDHIARSKITVSVSGGGWDCFRHYEAAALGSLPLMDQPTVDTCWRDIADGTFFFDSTFRNFQERLEFFLTCPERRSAALAAITRHVEQDMLHSKIVERIVAELLHKKNNRHRNHALETAADHPG